MKKAAAGTLLIFCFAGISLSQFTEIPKTLLPMPLLNEIIQEASGGLSFETEVALSGFNRLRPAEEYSQGYFETAYILKRLREYGIAESEIIPLSTQNSNAWYPDAGELWIETPSRRKIADIREIYFNLCRGSASTDTTAEIVYVGFGNNDRFYEGKDVKDKIVLVTGSPEPARRFAVEKYGAAGLIGYGSSHPEFDPDQVGGGSIRSGDKEKPTFAFMISTRQGQELRDQLERGQETTARARVVTRTVPYKEEMVSARIPGKEFPEEELVFVAHLFEGAEKQGANDNMSGCAAVLETARILQKLVSGGKIPPLKRSVRFLFDPEISGTIAYIRKYPEIAHRFYASIAEDMVGEDLAKTASYFLLELPLRSQSTYLPDVVLSFIEWMGTTQRREGKDLLYPVVSPTGTRQPFLHTVIPFAGGSDHVVFIDGGVHVPAVLFNVWPDMFYHSSADTPDKSDPTQLKRVAVISAASAVFLSNAGPVEAGQLVGEVAARGLNRIGRERLRAEQLLAAADAKDLQVQYKESWNIVEQAHQREIEALGSTRFFIRGEAAAENLVRAKTRTLEDLRTASAREMETVFRDRCGQENLRPQKLELAPEEIRLGRLVPVRTEKMNGPFNAQEFGAARRELKDAPAYYLGRMESEVRNFIDGKNSILGIRNAVSAEFSPVSLKDVENLILVLEKTGHIRITGRK
jgi:aminopeptidase YwaD